VGKIEKITETTSDVFFFFFFQNEIFLRKKSELMQIFRWMFYFGTLDFFRFATFFTGCSFFFVFVVEFFLAPSFSNCLPVL